MARLYPNGVPAVTYSAADMAAQTAPAAPAAQSDSGINTPPEQDFNTPAMAGSMQQFLSDNLGEYVVIEFLIGTQTTVQKGGILYAVGTSVVTLYEEVSQTFVTCDIFSVKFVTFFLPGHRPWQANNPIFPTSGMRGIAATPSTAGPSAGGCLGAGGGYAGPVV